MNNIDLRSTIHQETPSMEYAENFTQTSYTTWEATVQKHTRILKAIGVCDQPLSTAEIDTLINQLLALMDNRYSTYTMAYILETYGAETATRMTRHMAPWMVQGRDY